MGQSSTCELTECKSRFQDIHILPPYSASANSNTLNFDWNDVNTSAKLCCRSASQTEIVKYCCSQTELVKYCASRDQAVRHAVSACAASPEHQGVGTAVDVSTDVDRACNELDSWLYLQMNTDDRVHQDGDNTLSTILDFNAVTLRRGVGRLPNPKPLAKPMPPILSVEVDAVPACYESPLVISSTISRSRTSDTPVASSTKRFAKPKPLPLPAPQSLPSFTPREEKSVQGNGCNVPCLSACEEGSRHEVPCLSACEEGSGHEHGSVVPAFTVLEERYAHEKGTTVPSFTVLEELEEGSVLEPAAETPDRGTRHRNSPCLLEPPPATPTCVSPVDADRQFGIPNPHKPSSASPVVSATDTAAPDEVPELALALEFVQMAPLPGSDEDKFDFDSIAKDCEVQSILEEGPKLVVAQSMCLPWATCERWQQPGAGIRWQNPIQPPRPPYSQPPRTRPCGPPNGGQRVVRFNIPEDPSVVKSAKNGVQWHLLPEAPPQVRIPLHRRHRQGKTGMAPLTPRAPTAMQETLHRSADYWQQPVSWDEDGDEYRGVPADYTTWPEFANWSQGS